MQKQLLAAGLLTIATPALAETPVLTVLTYDSFTSEWGPGPAIEQAFEAECGCDLRFTAAGDGAALLLAEATDDAQRAAIGNQTGGRVGFFLETDDFARDHRRFTEAGIIFKDEPRHEPYGTVAVFSDPFGNRWDLIEPKEAGQ